MTETLEESSRVLEMLLRREHTNGLDPERDKEDEVVEIDLLCLRFERSCMVSGGPIGSALPAPVDSAVQLGRVDAVCTSLGRPEAAC